MRFARIVYTVAGLYGLAVLLPQYFLEAKNGRDYPPTITHPEYYYGFVGVALAWQVLFLILARDPVRYRPMMIPTMMEKAAFGVAAVILFLTGRLAPALLLAGIFDLILGTLFIIAYAQTGSARRG
jgi:hypothetical protein